MRSILLTIAIALSVGLFSQSRQVCFTVGEAQSVLDSLYALGDWKMMYVIQSARYETASNALSLQQSLDSLTVAQLIMCDSTARKGYSDNRELISDNAMLSHKFKNANTERWVWRGGAIAAILLKIFVFK